MLNSGVCPQQDSPTTTITTESQVVPLNFCQRFLFNQVTKRADPTPLKSMLMEGAFLRAAPEMLRELVVSLENT